MTSTQKEVANVLKFVTCLGILLLLNNIPIVHFYEWWVDIGFKNLVTFCGRHNCMIPNVKKVANVFSFVPVLQ